MLAFIILFAGSCFLAILVKAKWPGWLGMPLAFIVLCIIRDLGTTHIVDFYMGNYWVNPTEGIAAPDEINTAYFLVLLNYIALSVGMVAVIIAKCLLPHKKNPVISTSYSPRMCSRAWKASLLLFLFSILCQTIVFYFLLREFSILDIASSRAVFSAETATTIPLFCYARLLSGSMPIAVWGMMLFAGQKRNRMIIAVIGIISVVLFEVTFGSRMQLVANVFGIAVIYHYGIRQLGLRQTFLLAAMMLLALLMIQYVRLGVPDIREGVKNIAVDVLMTKSVNKAAFATRHFPEDVPFIGIGFISNELSKLVPTIRRYMVWNRNIWDDVVEHLRGGHSGFKGKGGNHYTPAAESYMQFGIRGVVFIGFFIGLLYGLIFSWQKRHPNNVFLLMFATYAFVSLAMGLVNGKMLSWVSSMGFGAILPIGFLVVAVFRSRREVPALGIPLCFCILFFIAKRLVFSELFDYTFAVALVFAYLAALNSIGKGRRLNLLRGRA